MNKSLLITREGWDALDKELKYLWKEERPRVTQSVSEAAAQGDRSENAEYIYGKKRLREIDRRVRFYLKDWINSGLSNLTHGKKGVFFLGHGLN